MNGSGTPNGTFNGKSNGRAGHVPETVRNSGVSLRDWLSVGDNHSLRSALDKSPGRGKENAPGVDSKRCEQSHSNDDMSATRPQYRQGAGRAEDSSAENNPLPAPLHIIQSCITQKPIIRGHPGLSTHTWSASQMSEPFELRLENGLDQDITHDRFDHEESMVSEDVRKDLEMYLGAWLLNATDHTENDPVAEWEKNPKHAQHGVNTDTGELLPPVQQPQTVARVKATDDGRDITFKQRTLTSKINMDMALRLLETKRPEPALAPNTPHERAPDMEELEWPKAECVLRPATEADLAAIADIANLEVKSSDCPQIIQSQAITALEMKRVLDSCRHHLRPFVVAEPKGDILLNRENWPALAEKAYLEYVNYKNSRPNNTANILGFAFVTEPRIGFLNTPCAGSRHSGQVRLVVHPDRRRHGYGSALLDKVLQSIAPYHRSLIDFDWQCTEDTLVYAKPSIYNQRKYARVYIESFSNSGEKEDAWRVKMLEKFQFKQAGLFTKMVKTDRGKDSKWLDVAI